MNTMPLEADTRVLIDTNLKNLGWHLSGKEQNVFFERAKTENEQKKLGGKRPDYVLYSKNSDTPLVVIEAKKKGERIDAALEQGIFYAKQLDAPLVYATDGVFCKSFHTLGNTIPKLNGEDVDEFIREALALKFLASWEVNTVSPKVQYDRKELIKIFDEANNMLRGDGLRAGIERFGEFANILFLKLISENEHNRIDYSCSWDAIKSIPPTTRIDYINSTVYQRLNNLYGTDIFTPLTIRDNVILKEIMDKLDPLTLTDVDSDVKGDAFEYFLKESTSTKNDLGEYFTPRHIVKTMVRLVNPQIGEKVYDPFCGTGGFLIETFRHIYNNMPRNAKTEKMLREETIYGNEITNTARITKMNMILAGDGHSNIHMKDSLAHPIDGEYDVVLANMPYSQKTKHGNLYDLPSTNGDSICVQHCMKAISSLSENGRMALVVPEGFLFRKELTKMREFMLENCQLQSVISLPQGVFLPYTGVKTNIIYATKVNQKLKTTEKRKDFWYFDVKSDGYTLDSHRRKLNAPNDLTKYEEYRKLDNDSQEDVRQELRGEMLQVGFEVIPLDKVRTNSNILVGSRYRTTNTQTTAYPLVNLGDEKLFTILSGGTPSSSISEFWNGDVNWITLADLPAEDYVTTIYDTERTITKEGLANSAARLLPTNTVVISSRATIGRIGITKTELATNQGFKNIVIKDSSSVIPEYLAYVLTTKKDEMINLASGGTFKEISKENISTIKIPLPPLDIQQKIILEIESYQRIIGGARAIVENYKPMITFNPNWEMVSVEDVVTFLSGVTLSVKECESDNGLPIITIADVSENGYINYQSVRKVETNKNAIRLEQGDLLFNWRNGSKHLVGKTALFDNSGEYIFASFLLGLRPKKELNSYFLWVILNQYRLQGLYINNMRMQVNGLFNRDELKDVKIPLPPLDIQNKIVEQLKKEKALIEPSRQIIDVFTQKIQERIREIWGE